MVGCSADETFCLNDYQKMTVKITSAHGMEDIACEKSKVDDFHSLLNDIELKSVDNNHENGWEVYCLLSNGNEDETQFLLLNNIITINEKSYEIQKNGDRDKWVQFFETIDKE